MIEQRKQINKKQESKRNKEAHITASFTPLPGTQILLHSCCAPCSGEVMRAMVEDFKLNLIIYFYNPNIHPLNEYLLRKKENIRYADKLGIEFIDGDYDVQNWFSKARGMEYEPERGERCTMCFDMRFEKSAQCAYEKGLTFFTSSLGISRWKDMDQINGCGKRAEKSYHGIYYWDYNWRLLGGSSRMYEIAKTEQFYKQQYCGCIYSLRDSNAWRVENGREKIGEIEEYYSK